MNSVAMNPAEGVSPSRLPTFLTFFAGGVGIGAWGASLPSISDGLRIDKATLGLILFGFALGAIVTMVNVGRLVPRFGTGKLCLAACGGFGAAIAAAAYAPSPAALSLIVLCAGASFGTLDVAMNTKAAFVEGRMGRHVMSSFHALFSVGNLAGAWICGQVFHAGGSVQACLTAAGICVILFGGWGAWAGRAEEPTAGPVPEGAAAGLDPQRRRHLLAIGAVAFLSMFAEGALIDWSAFYLVDTAGASESAGAFGFAIFAGAMAAGRFLGDVTAGALGPVRFIRLGAVLTAAALAVILTMPKVAAIYLSLGLAGLGIANLVPSLFAAAGRIGRHAAGSAMSLVATLGYTGLLVGPAVIGMLAQATSLRASLWTVVAALAVIAFCAVVVRPHAPR